MMKIELDDADKQRCRDALRHYFDRELDQDIGDLKAELLLGFILEKIGPAIYNRAIDDSQAYLQEKVLDMEAVLHVEE